MQWASLYLILRLTIFHKEISVFAHKHINTFAYISRGYVKRFLRNLAKK